MKSCVIRISNRCKSTAAKYNADISDYKRVTKKILRKGKWHSVKENSATLTSRKGADKGNHQNDSNENIVVKKSISVSTPPQTAKNIRDEGGGSLEASEIVAKISTNNSNNVTTLVGTAEIKKTESKTNVEVDDNTRVNAINMQMLSKPLHEQIFKNFYKQEEFSAKEIKSIKDNLDVYGIKTEEASRFPNVNLRLPPLEGNDIEQHFYNIGEAQVRPYLAIINDIMKEVPTIPDRWVFKEGWTRYTENSVEPVDYPLEDGIIFDIEVCMKEGPLPTIATAVTNKAWYGWVSKSLMDGVSTQFEGQHFTMDQLIPMESKPTEHGERLTSFHKKPKIVVGHNVSFDRSKIKEQCWINPTGLRFVDTMSLHISVGGISSYQRGLLSGKKDSIEKTDLQMQTSLNSLAEVHKFYCGHEIDKESRNIFVEGTLSDIKNDFNFLMTYCANDVAATHNVLCSLFPVFQERFPHPVTLAGMLELGSAYLPTNSNWQKYIDESESTFEDLKYETTFILAQRANAVCRLMHEEKYKEDLWMWNEDWSTQNIRLKSPTMYANLKKNYIPPDTEKEKTDAQKYLTDDEGDEDPLEKEFGYLKETRKLLPAKMPHMLGYPAWYRKLCSKLSDENWAPGPQNLSTSMQIVPKLLNLTWESYPLHYIKNKGWGILVPFKDENVETKIPIKQLLAQCPLRLAERSAEEAEYTMTTLNKNVESNLHKPDYWYTKKKKKKEDIDISAIYKGSAIWCDTVIDDCCYFLKLPHKDGGSYNVGNPMAKDFLNKFSENVLAGSDSSAAEILKIAKMLSYWRNNRDRIMSQFVVWLDTSHLPDTVKGAAKSYQYGVIIPLVVVTGTLTRRAVEATWMTASNAHEDRVGSELRAMIQAPPGYNIVGADVDSQELWIASMLGDAHYKNIHGATPFGWMTLIGTKSNETDMHSVTAKAVGISRSQAKIINYARIYGAGQKFAERLLKQFNPTMTDAEAAAKSRKMFTMTKGKKVYRLKEEYINCDLDDVQYSSYDAYKVAKLFGKTVQEMFGRGKWVGGSESAMFNRLEDIAESTHPVTPFLNSRLTRALETQTNSNGLPTKVNWVVQSGAVDFLHLMLVSMKWLMKDNIRFCLSFHDEVRYLVPSQYKYNAALAMHVTNLLTRCFCASRVGMKDLPMSVAFFTSVEVDTVLRKESQDNCKTPSNSRGLENGYEVPPGETLDIWATIEKSAGSFGPWHDINKEEELEEFDREIRIKDAL
ncbi:DNA polymerase gamma, catalytic subunit tam [Lasioglossum baleicum]|uniref:DNA polymerase gamma, catalytic subunit tam n=1 Tax=Lasioglossum baleicum TaxID=434251 RepID=UPI003FCDB438